MKKLVLFLILLASVAVAIFFLEEKKVDPVSVAPIVKKDGTPVPELQGIEGEINTKNLNIADLVGKKVILVDFWTYSCINCQRTLPYLTAWYERYKDQGLEIVGVHSPEFAFEKKYENVQRAVEKWNIEYPVVLDNEHATWAAFKNRYWPRKYLVDIDGYIVWDHIGEGAYEEAEKRIQGLLKERMEKLGISDGMPLDMASVSSPQPEFSRIGTPELYLGAHFTRGNFGNPQGLPLGETVQYALPLDEKSIKPNYVYLEGAWFVDTDSVNLISDVGKVILSYDAKIVNIVSSSKNGSEVSVFVNKNKVKELVVKDDDLYTLVDGEDYGRKTLEFEIRNPGFRLYTFTFG